MKYYLFFSDYLAYGKCSVNRSDVLLRNDSDKSINRDFPGSPGVQILPSNAGGMGLIPGQEAKIPHSLWPKYLCVKQNQYCNKFNKHFKTGL